MIPAHNEVQNIGPVVRALRALSVGGGGPVFDDVVVCDNQSCDGTARRALSAGARVVFEPTPGYGLACQTALLALWPVDAVLFVDGDQAFEVRQATDLLEALADGADLVIGSRVLGRCESGAMSAAQVIGNRTASLLIQLLWRRSVSDLGPFRAIRSGALRRLEMCDKAYGWTVEMQVKAIIHGLRVVEVPVDTRRRRHGQSKIGGTLRGVLGASAGILSTIARLRARALPPSAAPRPEEHAAWRRS